MFSLAYAGTWAPRLPTPVLENLLALSPALLRTLSTFDGPTEPDAQQHDKSYIDRLKVTARAGQGGNGCASFYQGASRGEWMGGRVRAVGTPGSLPTAEGAACYRRRRRHPRCCCHPGLHYNLQGSTPPPMVAMEVMEAMWWSVQPPSEQDIRLP